MGAEPLLSGRVSGGRLELAAAGMWTASSANELEPLVDAHACGVSGATGMFIDMTAVKAFDTFGAWLLERLTRAWAGRGQDVQVVGLPRHYQGLLTEVSQANRAAPVSRRKSGGVLKLINLLGRKVEAVGGSLVPFLNMTGAFGEA
jgi:phospholipid/cholesterol/gamma-HCH transport system permease protein